MSLTTQTDLLLFKELNRQEIILKTEEVQKTEQVLQDLRIRSVQNHVRSVPKQAHSVLKHLEQARNQEAASLREKAAQVQEEAEEEGNTILNFIKN